MKNLFSYLVIFLTLFVGGIIAPKHIVSEGWKSTILASLIIFGAEIIISVILIFATAAILGIAHHLDDPSIAYIITIVVFFLLAWLILPFSMYLADKYISGFELNGAWTYVLLTVIISFFSPKGKKKETE